MSRQFFEQALQTRPDLASTPINPDALYSVKQCQAWAGVCNTTWYRLIREKQGPGQRRLGRRTAILGKDFIIWRDGLPRS